MIMEITGTDMGMMGTTMMIQLGLDLMIRSIHKLT